MIARLLRKIMGEWCESHQRAFRSDFCPLCVKAWIARMDKIDGRPEWTRAEGTWPLERNAE